MMNYNTAKTSYHFRSGLDGDVIITDKETGNEVRVNGNDLVRLVINECVNGSIISFVENGGVEKFLKCLKE